MFVYWLFSHFSKNRNQYFPWTCTSFYSKIHLNSTKSKKIIRREQKTFFYEQTTIIFLLFVPANIVVGERCLLLTISSSIFRQLHASLGKRKFILSEPELLSAMLDATWEHRRSVIRDCYITNSAQWFQIYQQKYYTALHVSYQGKWIWTPSMYNVHK